MGGSEVDVPYGSQWSFGRAVRSVTVKTTSTREIEIVASFLPSPLVSMRQTLRPTSVIIRMDLSAAMDLSSRLREAFETHLEETRGHVERLEQVFESLDEKVRGKHCDGKRALKP